MRSKLNIIVSITVILIIDLVLAAIINFAIVYNKLSSGGHIPSIKDLSIQNVIYYCSYLKINYIIISICCAIISIILFTSYTKPNVKKTKQILELKGKDAIYGSSSWLLNEHTNEGDYNEFNKIYLPNFQVPSFLVRSEIEKGKITFNGIDATKVVNTITIGSTGSGKTKRDVEPTVIANCILPDETTIIKEEIKDKKGKTIKTIRESIKNNKPNFVLTDTKGELYHSLRDILKSNGYEIYKIDFKNPETSMSWNILWPIINYFDKYVNYREINIEEKEFLELGYAQNYLTLYSCYLHDKLNCNQCLDEIEEEDPLVWIDKYRSTWFLNKKDLENNCLQYSKIFRQKAIDEVEIITSTLISSQQEHANQSWFIGAQNLLKGAIYAYLEVYEHTKSDFDLKWFNIFNIVNSLLNKDKFCTWMEEHYDNFPESMSWLTCGNIITTETKVRDQYFSILSTQITVFLQESLQNILCENNIDIFKFDDPEKPKALFIVIPEEEKSKESIISIFLGQLYRALYYSADRNKNRALNRTTMFLIDEFANIAKIKNLDILLNTGRSRKICTSIIVQDLEQIEHVYGSSSKAIMAACLLIKYLKSISIKTNSMISQYCGQKTINKSNISFSKDYKPNYHLEAKNILEVSQIPEYTLNNIIVINVDKRPCVVKLENVWEFKHLIKHEYFDWEITRNYINFNQDYRVDIFNIYKEIETKTASNDLQKALAHMENMNKMSQEEIEKKLQADRLSYLRKEEGILRSKISQFRDIPLNYWTTEDKIGYEKLNASLMSILEEKRNILNKGE
ncbi:type IV secretory system conjugative DNA transfer family protein [Spiroplasma endosymbiont of Aspidapion aeneum]|uniref:type IV secretory system conjugative DNA transfer family protein n=1 Tax=Spiroplasma endosymbiont of Aspidapion aeneum TaxID=3066276 RepID=UPI00313E3970